MPYINDARGAAGREERIAAVRADEEEGARGEEGREGERERRGLQEKAQYGSDDGPLDEYIRGGRTSGRGDEWRGIDEGEERQTTTTTRWNGRQARRREGSRRTARMATVHGT